MIAANQPFFCLEGPLFQQSIETAGEQHYNYEEEVKK